MVKKFIQDAGNAKNKQNNKTIWNNPIIQNK